MTRIKRKSFIIKHFVENCIINRPAKENKILQRFSYQTVSRLFRKQRQVNQVFTDRNKADLYSLFINVLSCQRALFKGVFLQPKKSVMKVEKFKVLLYLKKSETGQDRQGPDHGTDHPQPHDGAVQLQALLYPRTMERT